MIFFTNKVTSLRFNCKHNRLSTSLGITRKLRHLSNLKRRQWTTNIHSPAINSMIITRISNSQVSSRRFDSRIVVRRFDTSNLQSMHRWSRTFDLFGREKLLLDVRKSTSRIDTRQSSDNTPRYALLRMLPLEFLHGFKCFSIDGTMRQRTKIVSHAASCDSTRRM